jgi:drug/metabolite transporter (DMT)-like permease
MGPGFFPFALGVLLAALGAAILVSALRDKNKGPGVERFHWGPVFWVLMPIVVFGFLLKILGMLVMGLFVVVVSSLGSHEFKLRPVLFLAVGLVAFCAVVFVGGLKLPIPLCPALEIFDQIALCRV